MIEIRSFRDLLRLFFIFRREFRLALIVTVTVMTLGAFLLPAQYESNARLLVKPGRDNATLPIEISNRQTLTAPATQRDPVVDEEKLLTGRPVVYEVAERYLKEGVNREPQGFWKSVKFYLKKVASELISLLRSLFEMIGLVEAQSDLQRLALKLEKNFSASHEPGSAVIEISFAWDDPEIARQVVRFWIEAYMAQRAQALSRDSLHGFYAVEIEKVSDRVRFLKAEIQRRLKRMDAVDVNVKMSDLSDQISDLTQEQLRTTNEVAGINAFIHSAERQIRQLPPEVVDVRELTLNPTRQELKSQRVNLQLEKTRLLRIYLPDSPAVAALEESMEQLQRMIEAEASRIESGKEIRPNELVTNLQRQLLDARLSLSQKMAELADYAEKLTQLQATRNQVLSDEPELSRLMLELENAQRSFALYGENLEKARIDQALDRSQISNIALIEQATLNPKRIFPRSLTILLAALPAGIGAGLLTIYFCYLIDQRIHDGARIRERFDVPLWASLPDLTATDGVRASGLTASLYQLYSQLPIATIYQQGYTLAIASLASGAGVRFVTQQLSATLQERGISVSTDPQIASRPGLVKLLAASELLNNERAFLTLREADQILLLLVAGKTTVPMAEHGLSLLRTAFGKVDGIILNQRSYEVPGKLLMTLARWRGAL